MFAAGYYLGLSHSKEQNGCYSNRPIKKVDAEEIDQVYEYICEHPNYNIREIAKYFNMKDSYAHIIVSILRKRGTI
jgi:hypothetical protein